MSNLDHLTETLDAFLARDNFPHAFLFVGRGSQSESATEFIDQFVRKIAGKSFSNVDLVNFNATGSNVESLRETLKLATLRTVSDGRKVVLMTNMSDASMVMQNVLLKILEEPPSNTIFVLLANRALIPTVMSRCQVFALPHLIDEPKNEKLNSSLEMLETASKSGTAERLALVSKLAKLSETDEELLQQLFESWLYRQVELLRRSPEKHIAVRASMDALQALRGNFNKKIILQNFLMTAL